MLIWVKRLSLGLVVFVVLAQLIRPSRTNPPIEHAREIGANLSLTPEVGAIFERSCNDCHSNRTVWLWYSGVAPASWLVAYDVHEGRRRMNFSEWDAHTSQERIKLLDRMCPDVSKGEMPGFHIYLCILRQSFPRRMCSPYAPGPRLRGKQHPHKREN